MIPDMNFFQGHTIRFEKCLYCSEVKYPDWQPEMVVEKQHRVVGAPKIRHCSTEDLFFVEREDLAERYGVTIHAVDQERRKRSGGKLVQVDWLTGDGKAEFGG